MRRKPKPPQVEPTPERAEVQELIEKIVAAHDRGENLHCHPLVYALNDLCDVPMPGMYVTGMLGHPDGPKTDVQAMVAHIMRCLPDWLEATAADRARYRAAHARVEAKRRGQSQVRT